MNLPRGRRDDLLTTKLDDEVVVYDPETKQAHSLNRLAVSVWNHADNAETVADLQEKVSNDVGIPINEAAVLNALRKLERAHLLLDKVAMTGPLTRREMLRKSGKLGAAVAVTPIIASALVPLAAAAASACTPGRICSSNVCNSDQLGRSCFCFPAVSGPQQCSGNYFCGQTPACNLVSDCPAGWACVNSCCDQTGATHTCAPPCGQGQLLPGQHGLAASGLV